MDQEYVMQIRSIRAQTLAIMDEITKTPKPTYSLDGQSVSWEAYLKRIQETVTWCNAQLAADDAWEIRTQAGT